MSTIKEYNVKLKSLKNTQKITRTMKMVAASKLRKAQAAQAESKVYAQHTRQLISRIAGSVERASHPLLMEPLASKRILILLFTSDKGLCGSFNHNVHKQVETFIHENKSRYEKIDLVCAGKRGLMYFNKRANVIKHYDGVTLNPSYAQAKRIGEDLSAYFLKREYDEIFVTHNKFFSPLSQQTTYEKILPIDPAALEADVTSNVNDYIFEPQKEQLLEYLIPHYLYFRIYFTLLENSAGEHGARMTAMDSATKNAKELIEQNTLLRNRARQAAITTELSEIIAGAEAV